ncbi:MAG: hypothetical protein LBN00_02440 [Oscillospiraceae bacterium]|jgi:ABC-2 type transport system permease protein|nr:hypothetical protein [Oscillospiraceae bacterium]
MIFQLFIINLKAIFSQMFNRTRFSPRAQRPLPLRGTAGKIGIAARIIYCVGAFGFMFFGLFGSMLDEFFALGIGWLYFAIDGVLVFGICTISCIFTAQSQIFNAKDNDLLLSMPLKPSSILLARILTLLVTEYAFEALISIPALLVWLRGGYGTSLGVVFFVVGFILLPLIALAVACLLAWILTLVTSRMRRKNIVTLVISVAFFAAYFYFAFNMQNYITRLVENGAEIAAAFRRVFPPVYFYGNSVANGAPLDALLFALCAVIPFALIIALLSANFVRVATTKRGAKRIEYREKALKTSTALFALNKKELSHYWSNPMYVLNMSMGSMFMVVGGVAAVVKRGALAELASQFSLLIPGLTPGILAGIALAFFATTNCASASLISIEGKSLWIARSLPVRARDALLSKLLMHLQIGALPGVFASLLIIIALSLYNPSELLIALLLPFLFTLFMGVGGLALNILLPKFDWVNEVQPVKQGMPVVLLMFGSMALLIVLALPYIIFLRGVLTISAYVWLVIAVIAALDALLYRWLVTGGAKRFDAYEV